MSAGTERFVSRGNRVLAVASWAGMAGMAAASFGLPGAPAWPLLGALGAGAAWAWLLLWLPELRIEEDGVLVRNPFREARIPWGALIRLDTRLTLSLHTPGLRVRVSAAPAPGALGTRRLARGRVGGVGTPVGELAGSDSGDAAALVRRRWEGLIAAGRLDTGRAEELPVPRRWRPGPIALAGAASAAAALALAAG